MKIDIIHFTPVIGGETTLVKAMYKILGEMGHEVRVINPTKSGKLLKGWATFERQIPVKIKDFHELISETDTLFFINSIHLKKLKKLEDRAKEFASVQPVFSFENKKVIFYEHGRHSSDLYDYPSIFARLKNLNNRIVVFSNTNDVRPYYSKMGYDSFVIRQPFDPTNYLPIKKESNKSVVNISFNSRYTANKRPQNILPYFEKYLGKDAPFVLTFRGNVRDNCSVWYDLFKYFEDPKIIMKDYANSPAEIYENQDYCLYAGYTTKSEKGKMEYSMLEAFFYGIPLIVEKDVIDNFRYDEYGISREKFLNSVICLTEENLDSIIEGKFDWKPYAENAKTLIEDFMPNSIKSRLSKGLSYFDEIPTKKSILEPLF